MKHFDDPSQWRCPACVSGGNPRLPPTRNPHYADHALCDPVSHFCACPCDTGELSPTEEHP